MLHTERAIFDFGVLEQGDALEFLDAIGDGDAPVERFGSGA
jgi:hypothetical protein